ncbi:MAG TPA: YoaK family protein [Jatrophihabitantaceae bacterium]|nr:YoaK family protein [Jatrophihabitantaceae bacterium]
MAQPALRPAREAALLLLTAVAAAADAISYLGLGKVFPANMTGNTVLMGIGLAKPDYSSAVRSAVALGGFVTGAALAGAIWGSHRTRTACGLAMEAAMLGAAAGLWATLGHHPDGGPRYALIALLGGAMGAQSGVAAGLSVGVSTTYITGTWTAVSTGVARLLRPRSAREDEMQPRSRLWRQMAVVVCYFGAALLSGYLFVHV